MNVLKPELLTTIRTLLAQGATQREIERFTGVDRKTIRRYQRANSSGVATGAEAGDEQIPPPRPPAPTLSACAPHRAWIEAQVELGRNAVSIYQDLVELHGFAHSYNSVKRFVASLKPYIPHIGGRNWSEFPEARPEGWGVTRRRGRRVRELRATRGLGAAGR